MLKIAREAADLLSDRIGVDLFEIRELDDNPGRGSYIYVSNDKDHYEYIKAKLEPGNYLAYCKTGQSYNQTTGEMYLSDIVFNPILYDRERELRKEEKREINNRIESSKDLLKEREKRDLKYCSNETHCEKYKSQPDKYDKCLKLVDQVRGTTERECIKQVKKDIRDFDDKIGDMEDDVDNYFDDWKEDIYTATLLTMIHEFGHALGLEHTPNDIENIMYNTARSSGSVLTGRQVDAVRCVFGLGRF